MKFIPPQVRTTHEVYNVSDLYNQCLFNSVSLMIYGDENHSSLLKLTSVLKGILEKNRIISEVSFVQKNNFKSLNNKNKGHKVKRHMLVSSIAPAVLIGTVCKYSFWAVDLDRVLIRTRFNYLSFINCPFKYLYVFLVSCVCYMVGLQCLIVVFPDPMHLFVFSCVTLAEAGPVVGPLRLSATFGYLVFVICNSKSFCSLLFKLCIMIVTY